MHSQTPESLQPQLALLLRRLKLQPADFNSISVALLMVSSLGLSAFTLTGCSGSLGHSAQAESGGKQAQLLSSRGNEGSSATSLQIQIVVLVRMIILVQYLVLALAGAPVLVLALVRIQIPVPVRHPMPALILVLPCQAQRVRLAHLVHRVHRVTILL